MGRIAWSSAPSLEKPVSLPDPPQTEDQAVNDWMQKAQQAIVALSQPNVELQEFLNDLLGIVKEYDRDSINSLDAVSETAGGAYTANEQTMLESLKTLVNGLRTNL